MPHLYLYAFFFFLVHVYLIPFLPLFPWIHHSYQSHYNLDVSISLGLLLLSFSLFSFQTFRGFFLSLQHFISIYQFVYFANLSFILSYNNDLQKSFIRKYKYSCYEEFFYHMWNKCNIIQLLAPISNVDIQKRIPDIQCLF